MNNVTLSFEFFPPKTETGEGKLWSVVKELGKFNPQFVSVTCGASGSAIDGTAKVVHHIRQHDIPVAPHVAIARQSRSRVRQILQDYKKAGINHIIAIRGDPPESYDNDAPGNQIDKNDLYPNTIDFVAELHNEFKLQPIVAAYPDVHPRALSPQQDLDHLKKKAEAGAALAISQFFFHAETFLRFRDKVKATGINIPLAPGIMPVHNLVQVVKFAQACGTIIPEKFGERFERHDMDAEALFEEAVAHASEVCTELRREGVSHFHFYTLNRFEMTAAVCKQLGLEAQGSGFIASSSLEPQAPLTTN